MMHDDDDFEHEHYDLLEPPGRGPEQSIQQLSLAIDVGSATTKLVFSRIHSVRRGELLNTHYVVVLREVLHRSEVVPTPYLAPGRLDVVRLAAFADQAYAEAELRPDDVETGAVILTGAASDPENARRLSAALAGGSRLICAAVGPHLAAVLAAHGAGAVAASRRTHETLLNVDLGASGARLALVDDGDVAWTSALPAEGSLEEIVAVGGSGSAAEPAAGSPREREGSESAGLAGRAARPVDAVTFSGGFAEYVYGRADGGTPLTEELAARIQAGGLPARAASEGIYATVIGASQLTIRASGYTIQASRPDLLPLRHLPVVRPRLPRREAVGPEDMAQAIRRAFERQGLAPGARPVALAVAWDGPATHDALRGMAEGILQAAAARQPLVLALQGGHGPAFYRILRDELGAGDVAVIDGIELSEFDQLDVGETVAGESSAPVIVKIMGVPRSGWVVSAVES
jgi:ethanolamine utilization protein EutA